jgi:osmotically inducible protein OsmC
MALSFALAKEGITDARLETTAKVKLEQEGEGFKVSRSDLELTADVPGLDEVRLRALAEDAKRNCPISKLLNADMDLTVHAGAGATA